MTSNLSQRNSRQLEPALALVQLLTLHPELPRMTWTVSPHVDGLLGCMSDAPTDSMDRAVASLGGEPHEPWLNRKTGRVSQVLNVVWQDVPVSIVITQSAIVEQAVAA